MEASFLLTSDKIVMRIIEYFQNIFAPFITISKRKITLGSGKVEEVQTDININLLWSAFILGKVNH